MGTLIMYHSPLTLPFDMENRMTHPETNNVVSPFVPDAREEADDFRPVYKEGGPDPKVDGSAPVPAEPVAPKKAAPRKSAPKKAAPKKSAPAPAPESETIVVVGEELPSD